MTLIRTSKTKIAYGISSNSRPSIYRLPRITPTPLAIFSFFYVLSVKLKSNLILQRISDDSRSRGGWVGIYTKPKNRSKNYPKPKNRDRSRSQPKTEYKTIITEDLYGSIFKTLV